MLNIYFVNSLFKISSHIFRIEYLFYLVLSSLSDVHCPCLPPRICIILDSQKFLPFNSHPVFLRKSAQTTGKKIDFRTMKIEDSELNDKNCLILMFVTQRVRIIIKVKHIKVLHYLPQCRLGLLMGKGHNQKHSSSFAYFARLCAVLLQF